MDKMQEISTLGGVWLGEQGINNWALTQLKAINFLELAKERSIAILGGDALFLEGEEFKHTYDNWSCSQNQGELFYDYVERSIKTAREFIENYETGGRTIFFLLVYELSSN